MSDWGKGATNNNIGWGQGFNNDVGWGSIYSTSASGDTNILGLLPDLNFTFTVNTSSTSTGSSTNTQFKLPLVSSFNGITSNVDWGDGSTDVITAFDQAEVTHTYASSGVYEIKISNALRSFRFGNAGDRFKMRQISNYGILEINTDATFQGCENMTQIATDAPLISTANLNQTLFGCVIFNGDIGNWDMSNVTSVFRMLGQCRAFNQTLANWDVSKVTDMGNLFFFTSNLSILDVSNWNVAKVTSLNSCFVLSNSNPDVTNWNTFALIDAQGCFDRAPNFNRNMAGWNITKVTGFNSFLNTVTISTANYDATLIGWSAQIAKTNRTISFGNSKFTLGGAAAAARANLISTYNWTITDGGGI